MISSRFSFSNSARAMLVGLCAAAPLSVALAEPVTFTRTEQNIDWTSAGISGTGGGSGTINLSGVTGPVSKAFLFWHGINNSGAGAVYDNPTITVNGNTVTGTAIGDATTNCWGSGSSRAFRADISSLVSGNGAYLLEGLSDGSGHNSNGAAMVVTYNDGNGANNRDLAFFEGNDSNFADGFPGETDGWNAVLGPIAYDGGPALAQIFLSDGQSFGDDTVTFSTVNGVVSVADTNMLYDGNSLATAGTSRAGNGELFDIHNFDITAAFGGVSGDVALTIDGMENAGDCLGLITLLLDLDPFTAPSPGINLDPSVAFNELNTVHDVTATVTDGDDLPLMNVDVGFLVTSGPNSGDNAQATTDAAGEAPFSYTGDGGIGVDTIEGSFSDGNEVFASTALKFWDNDCNMTNTPDTCDLDCNGFSGNCGLFGNCGSSSDDDDDGIPDECGVVVERCDLDGDGTVDIIDIKSIMGRRNEPATGPDDPADADGNGLIDANDARQCVLQCTFSRCAIGSRL